MGCKYLHGLTAPAALALSVALAAPAWAALGGNADSVSSDSLALRGQLHSTPSVQYDLHEITTGALVVREYVSRTGQVFALTWQGPTPPDLRQLLGSYFEQFQSAAATSHASNASIHRHVSLTQPDLIVQASGRLRAFHGLAYVPSLVPAGISVNQLP